MKLARAMPIALGAATTLWCAFAICNGLIWIARDDRYRNGVMIGALVLLLCVCLVSFRFTRRQWRLRSQPSPPSAT